MSSFFRQIWSLGVTAYELAIGEPPHAQLDLTSVVLKIPTSPPPTLPLQRFSSTFHSFLADCLVKDFTLRPSASKMLLHPFIINASAPEILTGNIRLVKAARHK